MILKTLHTSVILYTLNLQGCFLMNFFIFILFQEENMVFLNFLKREYFSRAISDPIKFSFFLFPSSFRPHQVFILFFPNPSRFHFSSFRPHQVFIFLLSDPIKFSFFSFQTHQVFIFLLSDLIKFSFFSFQPHQVFIFLLTVFFPTPSSFHFSYFRLLSDPIKFSFFSFGAGLLFENINTW